MKSGYLLNKIPTATYLGLNVICWGIATACTGAAQNYPTLIAARVILGIFESAIAPCLTLISSQWYTKSEQAPRFSFWYCGLGAGQITGGIISYGFQKVTNASLESWRIMFIFLGAFTVLTGIIVLMWLPNTPQTARFLNEEETNAILEHVAQNQIGVQTREFKISQVFELLLDVQFWLLAGMTMLSSISSGVVTTYSAILISGFGFKPDAAALLNIPSGVVSIVATLVVGFGVRYTHNGHRWLWIILSCIPGTLGGGLMSFLPSKPPHINKAGLLASIYMINAVVTVMAIVFQWAASNIGGQTKRTASLALIAASFSVGNIIGPQTFQAKDAPNYLPAKISLLATQGGCALCALTLYLYYRFVNHRRDKAASGASSEATEVSGNVTDKQNPNFRYVY